MTRRRCWCGRKVSTLPDSNGIECAEHDNPLPARLSPRAGTGTRRVLRRMARSPLASDVRAAVQGAFWPAAAGSGLVVGLLLLTVTRGSYAAWDGFHPIPTGGTR